MKLKLFFIISLSGLLGLAAITPANTNVEQKLEDVLKNPKVQLGLGIAGGVLAGTGLGAGLYKLNQMNALRELQYKYYKARLEYYRNLENTMNKKPGDYSVDDKLYAQKKVIEYQNKVNDTERKLSQLEQKRDADLQDQETKPLLPAENLSPTEQTAVEKLTTVSDKLSALTEDQVNVLKASGYSIEGGKLINDKTGEELSDDEAGEILGAL